MKRNWFILPLIVILMVVVAYFMKPAPNKLDERVGIETKPNFQDDFQAELSQDLHNLLPHQKEEALIKLAKECENQRTQQADDSQYREAIHKELTSILQKGSDWRELIPFMEAHGLGAGYITGAMSELERRKYTYITDPNVINELLDNIDKQKLNISEWTYNKYEFFTYFPSVLKNKSNGMSFSTQIGGSSVISPSIIYTTVLLTLPFEEFVDAIKNQNFTVNELAYAIYNNMEIEKLELLLAQTENPADLPVFGPSPYFRNALSVADIAIDRLNLPVLRLLRSHGIEPTNQVGLGTALDYAIHARFVFSKRLGNDKSEWQRAHKAMIDYLIDEGYQAHLSSHRVSENGENYFFAINHGMKTNLGSGKAGYLMDSFKRASFIDSDNLPTREKPTKDEVALFTATEALNNAQANDWEIYRKCASVAEELRNAQQLLDRSQIYKMINSQRLPKDQQDDQKAMAYLHDVDPEIARVYTDLMANQRDSRLPVREEFEDLLFSGELQKFEEYVSKTPLNSTETDLMFNYLMRNPKLVSAWQMRTQALEPIFLFYYRSRKIEELEILYTYGFDFEVTDKWGQDFFIEAMFMNSDTHIEFFLKHAKPANPKYGTDALDALLDKIYLEKELPSYTSTIIQYFPLLEKSHKSRLSRLKIFRPEQYRLLIDIDPRLEVSDDTLPNPVVTTVLF